MILRLLAVLVALSAGASAQTNIAGRVLEDAPWCDDVYHERHPDRLVACEVRETLLAAGALDVDGAINGPVKVKKWDRSDILVRARIVGTAPSTSRAERLVDETLVQTRSGVVRSTLPDSRRGEGVHVSYEIFAPRQTDLAVRAVNGPIAIHGLDGQIRARAVNGPVVLQAVGGDVDVHAINGPVTIGLEGEHWRGAGLTVRSENGPITIEVPGAYSAQVSAETQNGRITISDLDVCDAVRRRGRYAGDRLSGQLGRGGASLSLATANGPVRFVRND